MKFEIQNIFKMIIFKEEFQTFGDRFEQDNNSKWVSLASKLGTTQ